jgi:hypothetical protein
MNEQDFKNALRQTMTVQPAPPPMSDAVVLEAAHRDTKRRRAMMAGLGSAGAVAAVIVGVAVIAPGATGSGSGGVGVGAQVTSTPAAPSPTDETASATESDGKSTVNRPPGMTDDTARSGPEFDRGQALANEVDAVLPSGYAAPADLKGEGSDGPLKYSQATLAGKSNGVQGWRYMAITPVTKGTGVGELVVEVATPTDKTNNVAMCDLPPFWGETGDCTEVTVGGKKVAVVADTERFGQWAAYRHDDGTVVYIAQAVEWDGAGLPPLAGPVFTTEQLAALAADPRFNLD